LVIEWKLASISIGSILNIWRNPPRLTVNFGYFYVGFLMLLLNIPLFIALLIKGIREKQVLYYETMHLIVKIAIAFYLIEKSGI